MIVSPRDYGQRSSIVAARFPGKDMAAVAAGLRQAEAPEAGRGA
jgi:hypothetical protein